GKQVVPEKKEHDDQIQDEQLLFEREQKLRSEIFNSIIRFASAGDSVERIRGSVDAVANFLLERAEIVLSNAVKERFAAAEKNVLDSKFRKLSIDDLVDLATDTLVWRLSVLTDEEVEKFIKTMRGDFNADSVRLRYDGSAMSTVGDIARELRSWRSKSKHNSQSIRNKIRRMVEGGEPGKGIKGRVFLYRIRLPERFNESNFTPLQALLILYSVASDDSIEVPTYFFRDMMDLLYRGAEHIMHNPRG